MMRSLHVYLINSTAVGTDRWWFDGLIPATDPPKPSGWISGSPSSVSEILNCLNSRTTHVRVQHQKQPQTELSRCYDDNKLNKISSKTFYDLFYVRFSSIIVWVARYVTQSIPGNLMDSYDSTICFLRACSSSYISFVLDSTVGRAYGSSTSVSFDSGSSFIISGWGNSLLNLITNCNHIITFLPWDTNVSTFYMYVLSVVGSIGLPCNKPVLTNQLRLVANFLNNIPKWTNKLHITSDIWVQFHENNVHLA